MMELAVGGLRWLIGICIALWVVFLVLDWVGPTVPAELVAPRVTVPPAPEIEAWLAEGEAGVSFLRDNSAKQIVWADTPGQQTEWAVVYLHGFSANREEIRPLPDLVAERLGANLFLTRLSGHGRNGDAMAEPIVSDWVLDTAEAMAVGRALGQRVLVIGSSTGGSLAILAASDPVLSEGLAGIALLAPNLKIAGWGGRIIEWPGARIWGPIVVGSERAFTPRSAGHAANWTTRYPVTVLAQLGALTHAVRGLRFSAIPVPALFMLSIRDTVIDTQAATRAAAEWGGPAELVPVTLAPGDDPAGHVLAGDILSPGTTEPLVERILGWTRGL